MYNSPKKQKISSWETQEYSHGEHRSLEHQHFRGLTPQGQHPATGRLPTWHRQDPSQDFLVGMLCSLIFTMGPIPVTPPLSPSEEQRTAIVIFPDFPPQDGESELQVAKEKQWHLGWDLPNIRAQIWKNLDMAGLRLPPGTRQQQDLAPTQQTSSWLEKPFLQGPDSK